MDSLLNQAHKEERRAEALRANGKLGEAIECHENAAELLAKCLESCDVCGAVESLTLQHRWHLRQQELLKIRLQQQKNMHKSLANERLKIAGLCQYNRDEQPSSPE